MTRILVTGLAEAIMLCAAAERPPSSLVSINDTPNPWTGRGPSTDWTKNVSNRLVLRFDDVPADRDGYRAVVPQQVADLIVFACRPLGPVLLVHCAAGISRSSASTIVLLAAQGHAPTSAVDGMLHAVADTQMAGLRPDLLVRPNAAVVAYGDALLDLGGRLCEATAARFPILRPDFARVRPT